MKDWKHITFEQRKVISSGISHLKGHLYQDNHIHHMEKYIP